jgi:hypothetical protein
MVLERYLFCNLIILPTALAVAGKGFESSKGLEKSKSPMFNVIVVLIRA